MPIRYLDSNISPLTINTARAILSTNTKIRIFILLFLILNNNKYNINDYLQAIPKTETTIILAHFLQFLLKCPPAAPAKAIPIKTTVIINIVKTA